MKPRVPASKYKQFIEFVEFLKSEDALTEYFNEIYKPIFCCSELMWIGDGFSWDRSKSGHAFWYRIHRKWNEKLQREQNR